MTVSGRPGNVYVSSGAFRTKDLKTVFAEAERLGVGGLELSSGLDFYPDALDLVRRHRGDYSLLLHNYFPAPEHPFVLNLAGADADVRQQSLDHCRRALEVSAQIGAPFFAAHAGFALQPRVDQLGLPITGRAKIPLSEAGAYFMESLASLLDVADAVGVDFLIENNVVAPFNAPEGVNDSFLVVTPEDILDLYQRVDHPRFGILLDVGHLKVSARTLGFDVQDALNAVVPAIRAFHLSDNDGLQDSNEPFDANAWFLPIVRETPSAAITVEAYNLTDRELACCLKSLQ